jgi:hypothetical protein
MPGPFVGFTMIARTAGKHPIMNQPRAFVPLMLAIVCALGFFRASPDAGAWTQKEFLVTFWFPPPATDAALARVAAEGFNMTWATTEADLDVAARHHLRAMLQSDLIKPAVLDSPVQRQQLDALIDRVKHHPALEAYFLEDEPGAAAFPALGKLVAYLRERDPVHLAYINLFPTYASEQQLGVSADAAERARVGYPLNFAGVGTDDRTVLRYREHLKRFVEVVKPSLLSYDHYHFLQPDKNGKPVDGQQYFLNLALIRMAALEANLPFVNTIQTGRHLDGWREPTASEMRWLIFTTLAYGGRGISYFTYWGPRGAFYVGGEPSPLLKPVARLNNEMANLGPALLKLQSVAVYHTASLPYGTEAIPTNAPIQIRSGGEFVLGLFGQTRGGQPTAFMIVNRDYASEATAEVQVVIPGRQLQELDRQTGGWSAETPLRANRTMIIKLAPGDGRLFRVAGKAVRLATPKDSAY